MVEKMKLIGDRLSRGNLPALALIVLLGVLLYGHTLNAPWYLDDNGAILENKTVHRLHEALADFFSGRGLANFTFALNYRLGGTDVTGYHAVNILIHLVTSSFVFLLLKRVFRDRPLLALGGALLFLAHPLQTQAVTYVVQRMTSLAGLFFFLALYLYVLAREREGEGGKQWLFYGASLFFGAVAVLTKQNAAVLPVALLLFDRYFLPAGRLERLRRLLLYVAPFCLVPAILAAKTLLLPMFSEGSIENIGGMPDLSHLKNNSPLNYLMTQFSVIWIYLRLLFVPFGQVLDYDVAIVTTFWELKTVAGLLGIALLLVLAVWLRRRQPLVSAAIFWFFLTLSVESSIIPLDPVFEHRLYIPMFGFALLAMDALGRLPGRWKAAGVLLALIVLSLLSWQRNALWNDPVAFLEDNLRRSPKSERVHIDLANLYMKQNRAAEALVLYQKAHRINPNYVLVHINISRAFASLKQYQLAVDSLLEGLRLDPGYYQLYNNIGVLYNVLGRYDEAARYLSKGVMMEPDNATVHFNLGLAYDRLGERDQAIAAYRRSLALDGREPMAHFNLALALHGKGDVEGALQEFLVAADLDPRHTGTLFNAAMLCLDLGKIEAARELTARLQQLDPDIAGRLQVRISEMGG